MSMVDLTDNKAKKDSLFFLNAIIFLVILEISILIGALLLFLNSEWKYVSFLLLSVIVYLFKVKKKISRASIVFEKNQLKINLVHFRADIEVEKIKSFDPYERKTIGLFRCMKEYIEGTTLFLFLKTMLSNISGFRRYLNSNTRMKPCPSTEL